MLEDIPENPYFVPQLRTGQTGVDFLGLRQVNLNLMDACLPGINNVTNYIRPFALACWMHWKFRELSKRAGRSKVSEEDLKVFKEKIETLFTWGHKIAGMHGLPGLGAKPPRPSKGLCSLRFEDWGRVARNTSIMAAVWYGPASKVGDGLGLLDPVEGEFFCGTEYGDRLAEALDAKLRASPVYPLLEDTRRTKASAEEAKRLFKAWNASSPTKEEATVFSKVFYAPELLGEKSRAGRRHATLRLILLVLERARRALDVSQIRERLFDLNVPESPERSIAPELVRACFSWRVLQIRQAQRLALESLLSWVEYQMQKRRARDMSELIGAAIADLKTETLIPRGKSIDDIEKRIFVGIDDFATLIASGRENTRLSLFRLIDRLIEALAYEEDTPSLLPLSLLLLLLCAKLTELLGASPYATPGLTSGGAERISLRYWTDVLREHQGETLSDFFGYLFEDLIISQHLMVATGRFDGTASRFRFAFEEEGFVFLGENPFQPTVTRDRLPTALSLLSDCRILRRVGNSFALP